VGIETYHFMAAGNSSMIQAAGWCWQQMYRITQRRKELNPHVGSTIGVSRQDFNKKKEANSKCSIGLKIKAGRGGQPQTYIAYFEDWTPRPNADIAFEGTF
jgi:hypothetical protein